MRSRHGGWALLLALVLGVGIGAQPAAPYFAIPSVPTGLPETNSLRSVACPSATDCWAVGSFDTLGTPQRLVQRWNGVTWAQVSTPLPTDTTLSRLNGVTCTSTANCWAVGAATVSGNAERLVLRWNGTDWNLVDTPNTPGTTYAALNAVTCTSATNCWTVGEENRPNPNVGAAAFRWDGTSWNAVPLFLPGSSLTFSTLRSVACASANACMAVGQGGVSNVSALALRWNGSFWTAVTAPSPPGATEMSLDGAACPSATSCWTVGASKVSGTYRRLVVRWNGSTGSLEPTPLPAGTTSSTLAGVTCTSTTACWAVGEATGASGARALALRWNGSAWTATTPPVPDGTTGSALFAAACATAAECWLVGGSTVSDVFQRLAVRWNQGAWSRESTPVPIGPENTVLNAVACPGATSCWAVGYANAATGNNRRVVQRWNGTAWNTFPSPLPTGTTSSTLTGVTCTSAANCWAVGAVIVGGTLQRLVLRWNGTAWSIVSTPLPASTQNSRLNGVTCSSAANCWAVGRATVGNESRTLMLRWNGISWSVVDTPVPGTTASELDAVACASATACWAVGNAIAANERHSLAMRWDGATWSVTATPRPGGATSSNLAGVACASATSCWAVGEASGPGFTRSLALRWNGTAWTIISSPLPTGTTSSRLQGVTCTGTTNCWAVGWSVGSDRQRRMVQRWNGTAWSLVATPLSAGTTSSRLQGVTCTTATNCWAVGNAQVVGTGTGLSLRRNGTGWTVVATKQITGAWSSALSSIACPGSSNCWAVGYSDSRDSPRRIVQRWNGTTWSLVATPLPVGTTSSVLNGTTCPTTTVCWAVGEATVAGITRSLVLRRNGTAWTIVRSPQPTGATRSALNGVTCTTTTNCWAVGTATVSGLDRRIVQRWNGTAWSLVSTPLPPGTTASFLRGVTCTTATSCWAVGARSVSGIFGPLALRWNGTAWSVVTTPLPPGASSGFLDAVTCTSATTCWTVGDAYTVGIPTALALRWNGTTWSAVNVPIPTGYDYSGLAGVACASATACWAVGKADLGSLRVPVMMRWDGRAWFAATVPTPTGVTSSFLSAVTCPATGTCRAVGQAVEAGLQRSVVLRFTP